MAEEYKNEFGVFGERPKVEKKLYDAKYVIPGLIIFLILVTLPLWPNLGKTVPVPQPSLATPAIEKMKDKKCIEALEFMRTNHMRLLIDWRDGVVRTDEKGVTQGGRDYVATDGKRYTASLSNTCLECHSNKTQFCDQCHNYVAVVPNCWGCHIIKEQQVAQGGAK
jgi:hypothetical protein